MQKLEKFITDKTTNVLSADYRRALRPCFDASAKYYKTGDSARKRTAGAGSEKKNEKKEQTKK